MRRSAYFISTLKEKPSETKIASHALMLRTGMIRKIASGFYTYLPLGLRILRKVEAIIRQEMNRIGAQEMLFPTLIPRELWDQSGRWQLFKKELFRVRDRHDGEHALGPTHEESFTHFLRHEIHSYRDLPLVFYQIANKFRDEIRPRYGVIRSKEFLMKDAYSFHATDASLEETYEAMREAYIKVFDRCTLRYVHVKADSGSMGGGESEEFMVKSDVGEETIVTCGHCHYAANVETANQALSFPEVETAGTLEKIATPSVKTIEEVCQLLGVKKQQTIKAVLYALKPPEGGEKYIMVIIRGDLNINEVKLGNLFAGAELHLPAREEIKGSLDLPLGFLGPVHARGDIKIIADESLKDGKALICGANEENFHFAHVDVNRDFQVSRYHNLYQVQAGHACPVCHGSLDILKGIEVGHIFKLGKKYTQSFQVSVLGKSGEPITPTMGCYGIGVNRTLAAIIEQHHDENGIIWPLSTAPFQIILITLNHKDKASMDYAQKLHSDLEREGIEVLWDDREERAGFKFKDADLIGIPLQVVIGGRAFEKQQLELKWRAKADKRFLSIHTALAEIVDEIKHRP